MTNIDRDNSTEEDKEVKKDCIQESMGLSLDNPMEESEVWDSEESFYLPVLATQHSPRIPDSKTPIVDFKRQRISNTPQPGLSNQRCDQGELSPIAEALKVKNESCSFAVVSYAGHSRKGYAPYSPQKKNQDSILMLEDSNSQSLLLTCLDGHGEKGHVISQWFKKELETRLFLHPAFGYDIKAAISDSVALIERDILDDPTIDTNFSGTTLVLTVIRGHTITIANIGDSRITLGSKRNTKVIDKDLLEGVPSSLLQATPLSIDHKPSIQSEKERILQNGGRVFSVEYEDGTKGPERVWLSHMNIPGLAMSRSLCDQVAHSVGVSSVPECFERELDPNLDCILIIATDGLWEFMNDQEAIDIAVQAGEPSAAVNALIREATARWLVNEKVVDDISVCVAFLHGSVCTGCNSKSGIDYSQPL
mmetsp:Transcript_12120/g.11761  ORF Transcript_12120/g.11761 Transcript_12120/m.11761 type:complete len:421 (-) Transcript_12120:189-1451(-)